MHSGPWLMASPSSASKARYHKACSTDTFVTNANPLIFACFCFQSFDLYENTTLRTAELMKQHPLSDPALWECWTGASLEPKVSYIVVSSTASSANEWSEAQYFCVSVIFWRWFQWQPDLTARCRAVTLTLHLSFTEYSPSVSHMKMHRYTRDRSSNVIHPLCVTDVISPVNLL